MLCCCTCPIVPRIVLTLVLQRLPRDVLPLVLSLMPHVVLPLVTLATLLPLLVPTLVT